MDELREKLYEAASDCLSNMENMDAGSEEYKYAISAATSMIDTISDLDEQEFEKELKRKKARSEAVHKVIETGTTVLTSIGKIIIPVGIAILTMGFEKESVLSYTAGKNAVRDCLDALKRN